MNIKLKNYQKKAVRAIDHFKGRMLNADEMGLGKTAETLAWIYNNPKIRPVIVVCPANAKYVWEREARDHFGLHSCILEGRTVYDVNSFRIHGIFIINYDILSDWSSYILGMKPQVMIVDEVHYIKTPKTIRTKAVRKLGAIIPNVLALSGTPATSRPIELFPVLNMLKPDIFNSFHDFAWRYCQPRRTHWGWQYKGATRLPELHRRLKKYCMIRRLKADVLRELPEKTRIVVPLPMENRKEYDKILKDFMLWFAQNNANNKLNPKDKKGMKKLKKAEHLVKINYLRQCAALSKMKYAIQWIKDFFEKSDEKLVVFLEHKKISKQLMEVFGDIAVLVDGSVKQYDRMRAVESFQHDKKIRLLVGNFKAAGVAITLTSASTLVFLEMDYVPGNHTQAEDRIHRIGQKHPTFIYYLIAQNTIEEDLCRIVEKKQRVLDQILDGGKSKLNLDVHAQLMKKIGGQYHAE